MPRITVILFQHKGGSKVFFEAEQAANDQPAFADILKITAAGTTESLKVAGDKVKIDREFLAPIAGQANTFRLQADSAKELILRSDWVFEAAPRFFGRGFDAAGGVAVSLELHVPLLNQPASLPYLVLCCRGRVAAGGAGVFTSAEVGFCAVLDDLPALDTTQAPGLDLSTRRRLPWPRCESRGQPSHSCLISPCACRRSRSTCQTCRRCGWLRDDRIAGRSGRNVASAAQGVPDRGRRRHPRGIAHLPLQAGRPRRRCRNRRY